jgi:hypothetical protein
LKELEHPVPGPVSIQKSRGNRISNKIIDNGFPALPLAFFIQGMISPQKLISYICLFSFTVQEGVGSQNTYKEGTLIPAN